MCTDWLRDVTIQDGGDQRYWSGGARCQHHHQLLLTHLPCSCASALIIILIFTITVHRWSKELLEQWSDTRHLLLSLLETLVAALICLRLLSSNLLKESRWICSPAVLETHNRRHQGFHTSYYCFKIYKHLCMHIFMI